MMRMIVMPALLVLVSAAQARGTPLRFHDTGAVVGTLLTGPLNAITDVAGVTVGHVTLIEGADIRTGVTVVRPHPGNIFQDKVPAGFVRANGFGKFAGSNQIEELGEIETPIALTNTLSVAEGVAGIVEWTLRQPGNESVRSVNAVVGETNDGYLNAIRKRRVTILDVRRAIEAAAPGPVVEGSVGAGTGTRLFDFKGGIGTSSRRVPVANQHFVVGVLVQTNFTGTLALAEPASVDAKADPAKRAAIAQATGDGSIVIVVATDAPLSDRNLTRLARRAIGGLARTGSDLENGSGDFVVAFSTAESVRRTIARRSAVGERTELPNDLLSPLFVGVADATQEAIYNALFAATAVTGESGHRLETYAANPRVRPR